MPTGTRSDYDRCVRMPWERARAVIHTSTPAQRALLHGQQIDGAGVRVRLAASILRSDDCSFDQGSVRERLRSLELTAHVSCNSGKCATGYQSDRGGCGYDNVANDEPCQRRVRGSARCATCERGGRSPIVCRPRTAGARSAAHRNAYQLHGARLPAVRSEVPA